MVVQLHTARRRANTPAFSSPARSVTASPLTVSSVGSVHHHYHSNDQLDNTANHWRPSLARRLSQGIIEQFGPLMHEDESSGKLTPSIQSNIIKAKDGLSNLFGFSDEAPEDLIYNLFRIPNKSDASIGKLLMVLKNYGIRETDPRLEPMMCKIREIEAEKEERVNEARDPKHWKLSREDFKRVISEGLSLIAKTLQNGLVVPCWNQFSQAIKGIYQKCKPINDGNVAAYIPQLSRFSPDIWGVAICTIDGQRLSFGDADKPFCVQSISKAFNYSNSYLLLTQFVSTHYNFSGIASTELGADFVHQYVGQEPSGRLFNEICLDGNSRPHNPMVNSGAIIVTSLIEMEMNNADRFDYMLTKYRQIAGGEYVGFNNAVFLSEQATADRNFALSYYMKEKGCFPPTSRSLKESLDFYFQLCSLEINCQSAAVMAATLANGGVCPISGERCIGSRACRDVLTLMNSCGMYDYSGQFAFHVGLPAKSGVSGAMIVVIPNLMGIALWSPPLDGLGNSCRGVAFCKELINRFNFHNYDSLAHNDDARKLDPRRYDGEREKDQVVSLLFAAKAGDLNTIRRMYMQGCNLEIADYDKRTALHLAASEGQFEVALFLVDVAKVKPDPRDRWNRTPLDDAHDANHTSCSLLIERRMNDYCSGRMLKNATSVPSNNRQVDTRGIKSAINAEVRHCRSESFSHFQPKKVITAPNRASSQTKTETYRDGQKERYLRFKKQPNIASSYEHVTALNVNKSENGDERNVFPNTIPPLCLSKVQHQQVKQEHSDKHMLNGGDITSNGRYIHLHNSSTDKLRNIQQKDEHEVDGKGNCNECGASQTSESTSESTELSDAIVKFTVGSPDSESLGKSAIRSTFNAELPNKNSTFNVCLDRTPTEEAAKVNGVLRASLPQIEQLESNEAKNVDHNAIDKNRDNECKCECGQEFHQNSTDEDSKHYLDDSEEILEYYDQTCTGSQKITGSSRKNSLLHPCELESSDESSDDEDETSYLGENGAHKHHQTPWSAQTPTLLYERITSQHY